MYTLVNNLSGKPKNCNAGYNNSWVEVLNNTDRELFAQASYITNFDDLKVNISTENITVGALEIKDGNSNLKADVASAGGYNALRVLSQDLESSVDDISIGDKYGNHFAEIEPTHSALKVYPVIKGAGFTKCETKTSGTPSFISNQILIHNNQDEDVSVSLTLTSGMSCLIPVGNKLSPNNIMNLDLSVLDVNDYAGCQITFFS